MITPMRIRRVFLFSAIVLLLLVSLVGVFFKPLIRFAMRPGTSCEEAKRPAAFVKRCEGNGNSSRKRRRSRVKSEK